MATPSRNFRLSDETVEKIKDLGKKWGGIRVLPQAQVLIELVNRAWEAEFGAKPAVKKVSKRA